MIAFDGKHVVRHAVLVMRDRIDAGRRHLVTWSKWPSRHNWRFRAGNGWILFSVQLWSNDSVTLVRRFTDGRNHRKR